LPGVSRWAFSYGAEYNLPAKLLGAGWRGLCGVRRQLPVEILVQPVALGLYRHRGYSVANFRAGFRTAEQWDIYGFVKNAFDKNFYDVLAIQAGSTGARRRTARRSADLWGHGEGAVLGSDWIRPHRGSPKPW
jgi:iron complex outermembrane receptor protein